MFRIEVMTVEGSRRCIVQDCLVGQGNAEYRFQDISGLSGAQCKGDIKGKDRAQDVGPVMNLRKVEKFVLRCTMGQLIEYKMILPVLIGEFELRTPCFHQFLFPLVEFVHLSHPLLTIVIAAFVDEDLFPFLPRKQSMVAIVEVIFCLSLESPVYLKELAADLA